MPVIPLTPLQELIEEHGRRFGRGKPWETLRQTLQEMADAKKMPELELESMVRSALQTGQPIAVFPLTPLQKLVGDYSRRFDHGIPLPTLQRMAEENQDAELERMLKLALQTGKPIAEWRDYRPLEGTWDAAYGGYKNPPMSMDELRSETASLPKRASQSPPASTSGASDSTSSPPDLPESK